MYVKLSAAIVPMLNTNDKVSTFYLDSLRLCCECIDELLTLAKTCAAFWSDVRFASSCHPCG